VGKKPRSEYQLIFAGRWPVRKKIALGIALAGLILFVSVFLSLYSGHEVKHRTQYPIGAFPAKKPSRSSSVSADEETLKRSLSKLRTGNLAYITPEKMKTGQTALVTARIATDKVSADELSKGMSTGEGGKVATARTPISIKMKMILKGADFDITSLSSEEQFVAGDTPTIWEWQITPKRSGELRLRLAAVVVLQEISRDLPVVDRDIAVEVNVGYEFTKFLETTWQWIIGAVGTVLVAGWKLLQYLRKRTDAATPVI
jgi:hypothetical protein